MHGTLRSQLLSPVQAFFRLAHKANVTAILIGGGAAMLNGSQRQTRDLDINISKKFALPTGQFYTRTDRDNRDNRWKVTYIAKPEEFTKIDIAVRTDIDRILPYTERLGHIVYSRADLLAVAKIRTIAERAERAAAKRQTDLLDLEACLSSLMERGMSVCEELWRLYLPEATMKEFWRQVPEEEHAVLKDCFQEVGIPAAGMM
ncbi:hypothetical protein BD410DRAFT_829253 [Rickenella mellea]|uniref:Nucleotidyl transferase AbiEii/AbiGii toxin family protein n=1 Tax=Rickenella mellea TaxID=50990 RepID=A0A4Y7Q1I8_9AGAM|nr:hypothetical protein BD410DRAFT_829253 [Rickenella mellea]